MYTPAKMLALLLWILFAMCGVSAHMAMANPAPLKSVKNPNVDPGSADFNINSPISSWTPCKYPDLASLLASPGGAPVATWAAGSSQSFTIEGGAPHGGGSCQASLSLDGGKSFTVIHSYEGGCPGQGSSSFNFKVPSDVPATKQALFAWSWFNHIGNREMYMNCAVVDITSGSGSGGKVPFSQRPQIFKANVGNGCRTVDSADLRFPNPGPDLDSNDASVPPTGTCGDDTGASRPAPGSGTGNGGNDSSEPTHPTVSPVITSTPTSSEGCSVFTTTVYVFETDGVVSAYLSSRSSLPDTESSSRPAGGLGDYVPGNHWPEGWKQHRSAGNNLRASSYLGVWVVLGAVGFLGA
ncbi:hypothetical protein QBC35DRAFT_474936 [Podospora australis]|uniref:Extracellular protein n=1 Tax=Podospora australis TaxID=1536484 RepID=A0AAN6WT15_9PEZI|nr:hypothetical protein QBC35DRAFT_474936 [Podospora australis]